MAKAVFNGEVIAASDDIVEAAHLKDRVAFWRGVTVES